MILALDIETKCAVSGCTDTQCNHALIPHLGTITCVGIWSPSFSKVFRGPNMLTELALTLATIDVQLIGQNFKFDLRFLQEHGLDLRHLWAHDTQLMAHASTTKIPQHWLDQYEVVRREENKKLPRGYSHRPASSHSLKTLAPFFLGVEAFWENPADHDSDEYVLKDCEYTYRLFNYFQDQLKKEDVYTFYNEFAMPRARMLLDSETKGITLDQTQLAHEELEVTGRLSDLSVQLDEIWQPAHAAYYEKQVIELRQHYYEKAQKAKGKDRLKVAQRYTKLCNKALEQVPNKINLGSPKQLLWLFKDHMGLDVENFSGSDSTGAEVLQRLARTHDDIKLFLSYREAEKLSKAFFPSYRELVHPGTGAIHTSFNLANTKTGRLSSSLPNLQQVPGGLHRLFVARPGYKLITRDMSYIEPRLIAYYTESTPLCDLILRDGDFHSANAILMFGLECAEKDVKALYPAERFVAKTCGLALLYGASARRIEQTATQQGFEWSPTKCQHLYQQFKSAYSDIFTWKRQLDSAALSRPIKNFFGRLRSFQDCQDDIHMQAFNGLIQGSASDMVVDSAYKTVQEFARAKIDGHLLLLVHDEQVWEVREDQIEAATTTIDQNMTSYPLPTKFGNIPLKVEGKTSERWEK